MDVTEKTTRFPSHRHKNARMLSYAWWAVVSRFLLHGLIVSTWVSLIPAVQNALHLNNGHLGFCLLGSAIGSIAAIPVAGWSVHRFGSRRIASWSSVGFAIALLLPAFAWNAPSLFLALAVFGACAGTNDVAINAQGVAVENACAEPTMSRFHAMFSIGGMAGASVGALLAHNGINTGLHASAAAAILVTIALATAPWLFEAGEQRSAATKTAGSGLGSLSLRRIPGVLIMLASVGFCMFLSEGAMADWTGVYLQQVLGTSPALAATGYAVFSTGMALFRLLGDAVTARLGPVKTVRAGSLLAAAALTLVLTATNADIALVGFALTGAGFSVIIPSIFAAGGKVTAVPPGVGIATVSGLGYIGFLFGPPVIGFIAQHTSLRSALVLLVVLSLMAAFLAKAVTPQSSETSETAPALPAPNAA